MTRREWEKNDALMKAALKKMHLFFSRNKETWEAVVSTHKTTSIDDVSCYTDDDYLVVDGPSTPESLGEISYFYVYSANHGGGKIIPNIFFGVHNSAELKIKLDLMA